MRPQGNILIVEDDPDMRLVLQGLFDTEGYVTCATPDGSAAIVLARQRRFDVAIVDLVLPGLSGVDTIRQLKELAHGLEVVILTGHPSLDTAIGALHDRVFGYLLKPVDVVRLKDVVRGAVLKASQNDGKRADGGAALKQSLRPSAQATDHGVVLSESGDTNSFLVGSSAELGRIRALIAEVGPSDLTVLVRGETGTGKEVVARRIHASSGRFSRGLFEKITCPAIPDHLFESEMFGHEKGAFTGAVTQRVGRFELGAAGTILLDEIGAISMEAQSKLLEVIEQKQFSRLGGRCKIKVDVRILGATNAPLEEMIQEGRFRPDLLYRLQQFTIVVPPLRDHKEDIPELAYHFMKKYAAKFKKEVPDLSDHLMLKLCEYDWPGNVRELDATIAKYCLTGNLAVIEEELGSPFSAEPGGRGVNSFERHEITALKLALSQTHGNQRRAASLLGLSYGALRRRVAKYNLN
jgi:DNA-binding NtrC family response regulator